jgi:hypothetical protein
LPALLLKLVPFRDYAYAGAVVAAVLWYNVHVHELERAYAVKQVAAVEAAVTEESTKVTDAAKKILDAKQKEYAAKSAQTETQYATALKSADDRHASDLERVRELTAQIHRGPDAVLPGPAGPASGSDVGPTRAEALGIGAELADALRRDDAQLQACWDDRDALTGK